MNREVEKMDYSFDQDRMLVLGGKGLLAHVYDVEKEAVFWKARNVPHDNLDLPVPMWDTDGCWSNANHGQVFAACTAYKWVLFFLVLILVAFI